MLAERKGLRGRAEYVSGLGGSGEGRGGELVFQQAIFGGFVFAEALEDGVADEAFRGEVAVFDAADVARLDPVVALRRLGLAGERMLRNLDGAQQVQRALEGALVEA